MSEQLLGRWDLSAQVLEFLVGHKKLLALLQAALVARTSPSKPKHVGSVNMAVHCDRAKVALDNVLKMFGHKLPSRSYAHRWDANNAGGAVMYSPAGHVLTAEQLQQLVPCQQQQLSSELQQKSTFQSETFYLPHQSLRSNRQPALAVTQRRSPADFDVEDNATERELESGAFRGSSKRLHGISWGPCPSFYSQVLVRSWYEF